METNSKLLNQFKDITINYKKNADTIVCANFYGMRLFCIILLT